MRYVFRKHGKLWDDEVAQQVKLHVAQLFARNLRKALEGKLTARFDSFVGVLEARVSGSRKKKG